MNMDDPVASLRTAERRLQAAQLASDVPVLIELLADDVLFTGPDGSLLTKEDDLAAHRSGQQVLTSVEEEDLRVLAGPHLGVTWFLGSVAGTVGGQPFAVRMRYTRTWANTPAGWQVVAAHASLVA